MWKNAAISVAFNFIYREAEHRAFTFAAFGTKQNNLFQHFAKLRYTLDIVQFLVWVHLELNAAVSACIVHLVFDTSQYLTIQVVHIIILAAVIPGCKRRHESRTHLMSETITKAILCSILDT